MSHTPPPSTDYDAIDACKNAIRNAGLRATPARIFVLHLLRQTQHPMSHADICDALDEHQWNQSTIWRNLTDLETAKLIQRIELGDRLWRFEAHQPQPHHLDDGHPHFICTNCGDVTCLPDNALVSVTRNDVPQSLQHGNVQIQIRGLCDHCH